MRAAFLCLLVAAAGCGKTEPNRPDEPAPAKKPEEKPAKKWTREEFRRLVVGKTPENVIKSVGKPDRTHEVGGVVAWTYDAVTVDPVTGKTDRAAQVIFERGVVDRVSY